MRKSKKSMKKKKEKKEKVMNRIIKKEKSIKDFNA